MLTHLTDEFSVAISRDSILWTSPSQNTRTRSLRFSFAVLSFVILGSWTSSFGQADDRISYQRSHQVEQRNSMDLGPIEQLTSPRGHSRAPLRSVDGFGDSEEDPSNSSTSVTGIGGLSTIGSIISNAIVNANDGSGSVGNDYQSTGSNAYSRGSGDLQSPITQDPCSKAITFVSNIDIDTDGRGNTVPSRTELPATSFQSQGKSLNSDQVNFIVMPGNCATYLGRYASVTYRGETVHGIVGDCGPAGKTGEVSTAMAKQLSDKLHGKGKGLNVPRFEGNGDRDHSKGFAEDGALYTIYPQGVTRASPITNSQIDAGAHAAASNVAGCVQRRQKSAVSESMRF